MLELEAALAEHREVTERFRAHLAPIADGSVRVPHLDWTISELGAHVLAGLRAYARAANDGVPVWEDVRAGDAANAASIAATPERQPAEIASAMPAALEDFRDAMRSCQGDLRVWGHIAVPSEVAVGISTGDVSVHGWDLAQATRRPWRIEPSEALITIEALYHLLAHFLDEEAAKGLRATYGISIRGGPSWTARFHDGTVELSRGRPDEADCRLSNDPVAFLLLGYGRVPLWKTALRGGAVAYGRKPWLGLRFTKLFLSP